MARPVPVFGSHIKMASTSEGPQHVRVFHEGRFLYASWDGGREAILDIRAHDRAELLHYLEEWTRPAPPEPRHERTPERAAPQEPRVEYVTSLSPTSAPKKRRMTLAEFLVS